MIEEKNMLTLIDIIERNLTDKFKEIEEIEFVNQRKVINSFKSAGIGEQHFQNTTGYGYSDLGREGIEDVYKSVFECEGALVRSQIVSGTHALACSLFGNLKPGDKLISVTGKPYDTLENIIGISGHKGSLMDYQVKYSEIDLASDGKPDIIEINKSLPKDTKLIYIQRSRGYSWRSPLSIEDMQFLINNIKKISPNAIVMVDNCYGEFVEIIEPTQIGADLAVGSLIKNPGGGIAPTGGYIVGKEEFVENSSFRLTAPGIGSHCGSTPADINFKILFGLYMAPHVVSQALKGSLLASSLFDYLGYSVSPKAAEKRKDTITAIEFNDPKKLIAFCQYIQESSPINAYVKPEPWDMPGYQHQIIMAGGTFVQGSSIELSVDGPIRPPFIGYLQGGLTYSHIKHSLIYALEKMQSSKLL
jgi:cystathionine beta-lyase family protein involved in aluminum resistance